ncbi:alkaline phosphatase PafA [Algivirga pacifica]|uniref:Alkaline phosphatase family protein n=1 Tax=Algivirga pacifica TaxID=1162670 RepID=A0ABP9D0S9_9BACT
MKKLTLLLITLLSFFSLTTIAQQRPKLVVGIVVDQMRYDYLQRYWYNFEEGGFKRLVDEGYICRNASFDYAATQTGPGHASIYTGTYPAHHGIVGNHFYDRALGKTIYCVEDTTERTVGIAGKAGARSPRRLQVSTLADEIKLASNMRSKVVAVSLKDRSSILPAGHAANGAYWMDDATGSWVSSTFYMEELPKWVKKLNKERDIEKYAKSVWKPLLSMKSYTASHEDDTPYEGPFKGREKATFPYPMKEIISQESDSYRYGPIKATPFGNTLVKDFAKEALQAEELGQDDFTDLLAISFSSTDYVGHQFGPMAIETEDTYLRLDRDLKDLIEYIDEKVGLENTLFFLTADHGGAHVPSFTTSIKMPGGYYKSKEITERLEAHLDELYGEGDWIDSHSSGQVYLNRSLIKEKKLALSEVQEKVAERLVEEEVMKDALTASQLNTYNYTEGYKELVQHSYNRQNSPDVYGVPHAHYLSYRKHGTSHGMPHAYDTQVPMLFFGWKVTAGETFDRHYITEITPTVTSLLNLSNPSGVYSDPVTLPLKK